MTHFKRVYFSLVFFILASFFFNASFAHCLHGHSHLKWFSNNIEGVSKSVEYLLTASVSCPTHPKPSQLESDSMIVPSTPAHLLLLHSGNCTFRHRPFTCAVSNKETVVTKVEPKISNSDSSDQRTVFRLTDLHFLI